MGIDVAALEFLLKANAEIGDFKRTVILGRQRLLIRNDWEHERYTALLKQYRPDLSLDDILHDYADFLLLALGATTCHVMDNSDYEGADLIHDLNTPLPNQFKNHYDTVIDIGALEHAFNIGTAMKSMAELVKVGGHFLCLNIADHHLGHGFWQFSPEVFFRTFSSKYGFEKLLADLHYKQQFHPLQDPEIAGRRIPLKTTGYTYITFAAQKIADKEIFADGWPVQADYKATWTCSLVKNAQAAGKRDLAENILRKAITEAPKSPIYKMELSRFLRQETGHEAEIDKLSLEAYELAPDFKPIVNERKAVLTLLGRSLDKTLDNIIDTPDDPPKEILEKNTSTVDIGSIKITLDDPRIPEKTRKVLLNGRYEFKEREIARRLLFPGDRVIELGAGMGVVSLTIAKYIGCNAVRSFEANPQIIELARQNATRMNCPIQFIHAIASPRKICETTSHVDFFVLNSFEASSTRQVSKGQKPIEVSTVALEDMIEDHHANVLIFDIEGYEKEIITQTDLSQIDKILFEIHPKVLGFEDSIDLVNQLELQGFILRTDLIFGDVIAFERGATRTQFSGSSIFKTSLEFESAMNEQNYERAASIASTDISRELYHNPYFQYRLSIMERALGGDGLLPAERAIELGSHDFQLYADLGLIYCNMRSFNQAKHMKKHLQDLFPRSPAIAAIDQKIKSFAIHEK